MEISFTAPAERSVEAGQPLAARVNNSPIFLGFFRQQVAAIQPALAENVQTQVLQGLIDQQLMAQQAGILGLRVSADELAARVSEAKNRPQFKRWLAQNGLTEAQFETNLEAQKLFEQITAGVSPQQEMVRLNYIRVDDLSGAEAIIQRLKQGENFVQVEQEVAGNRSGYVDWFPRQAGLLPDVVEASAFKLQPGEIPHPIVAPDGVYLIKLEGREVNRSLSREAWQKLKQQVFSNWLQTQRDSAQVEIFVTLP